jgi:bifunctional non-homologous end joining protein LigD
VVAWLHEIKHDGFRVIARKNAAQVRLYSRPGNDLTHRFPLIVETLARLRSRSCIIDGEAVACDDNGVASFDLVSYHRANERIFLYAFDLIELNGDDLRPDPLEGRKATLQMILAKAWPGIRFNEHMQGDGETVFRHVCVPKTRFCNSGDEGRRGRAQIQYRPRTGWRDGSERPR